MTHLYQFSYQSQYHAQLLDTSSGTQNSATVTHDFATAGNNSSMLDESEEPKSSPVYAFQPNPDRPAVSAAVAAQYFQKSRYYVTELIKQGEIEGYGIQKDKAGRVRWYVYEDTIPSFEPDSSADARRLLSRLLEMRQLSRNGQEARVLAHEFSIKAAETMREAVQVATGGRASQISDLLISALGDQSASAQRQLEARRFEIEAEALLDQVLNSFAITQNKSDSRLLNEDVS